MNILHLNSYYKKGGAESVFLLTYNEMNKIEGLTNYIGAVSNGEKVDINFKTWEEQSKIKGIFTYIYSKHNYKELKEFLCKNHINIIHIHNVFPTLSNGVLKAIKEYKKHNSIKVIQTIHDFHLICPNSTLYNFNEECICEKCIQNKFIEQKFLLNCDKRGRLYSIIKEIRSIISNNVIKHKEIIDKFIAPSDFMKDMLIKSNIDNQKIEVIRNPIITNAVNKEKNKDNIICYFGRLSKEKNVQLLIEAFCEIIQKEKYRNYKLIIIGEGECDKEIRARIKFGKLEKKIITYGFLDKIDLFDKIKESKFFVLPSKWYENAPMTLVEALSLNIIPIASNIGGMKESIQLFKAGLLFENNNLNSLKDTLIYGINNYNEEARKVEDAKKIILRELSIKEYTSRLLKLYNV